MQPSETLRLACDLVALPSVTPDDHGCQPLIARRLGALGFEVEPMPFEDVANLWALRGAERPRFVFAGHTDVVPTGPIEQWTFPPFEPTVRDGLLYGRGAADMKGSLAAMVVACERFLESTPEHRGSIGFLITSDEEGPAHHGTRRVVETLRRRGVDLDWCLVGEPSSSERLGDVVRHGRRGSLNACVRLRGVQGHVAYPDRARNPIHGACAALAELSARRWDDGDQDFPPTSFQVSNIRAGTGAVNTIPGDLEARFNFRYSTALDHTALVEAVETVLAAHATRHQLDYEVVWDHSGAPFLTRPGELTRAVAAALERVTGAPPAFSTGGGTSDGRFIAPAGAQVVELGPVNATIHKVNEHVRVADLDRLTDIYVEVLRQLLNPAAG